MLLKAMLGLFREKLKCASSILILVLCIRRVPSFFIKIFEPFLSYRYSLHLNMHGPSSLIHGLRFVGPTLLVD